MAKVSEVKIGSVFGRLTVMEIGLPDKRGVRLVTVKCDCGTGKAVRLNDLGPKVVSCGCYSREVAKLSKNATHGCKGSPEYRAWTAMWDRCTNPKHLQFVKYKDRLPTPLWRDFAVFLADMGRRPSSKHSLERLDNDGRYDADNCIWATTTQQSRNKSNNIYYSNGSITLTIPDIAVLLGISKPILYGRLRRGWTAEETLGQGWFLVKKETDDTI